jgi:hypothetical protein
MRSGGSVDKTIRLADERARFRGHSGRSSAIPRALLSFRA